MSGRNECKRHSPYPLRERKILRKMPFQVPLWAGGNSVNTCIVDSFLATLVCAQSTDPAFIRVLRGHSKFTKACREFLEDESSIEERKEAFIKKLFQPNPAGEFNLEGDEVDIILEKAKEGCTVRHSSQCPSCGHKYTNLKDYFYAGREAGDSLVPLLYAAVGQMNREHRCPDVSRCQGVTKRMGIVALDATWLIPIDISQHDFRAAKIRELPVQMCLEDVRFRLTGVSLYSPGHYTAVLTDDKLWYYYDGMMRPPLRSASDVNLLSIDVMCKLKIVYYIRIGEL